MASHLAVQHSAGRVTCDLLKVVLVVLKNNSQFKPSLERLQKMIEDMAPNIKRIETFNSELDQPQQLERLQGLMSDGRDLVQKCSKIHKYNCLKRPLSNKKLLKLEKDIRDHINIVLQLEGVADTKEIKVKQDWTLAGVNNVFSELRDDIGKLMTTLSNVDRLDSINSNIRLPVGSCWIEIPLSELRIKLLKDETSQHIVISAPGGCGKTTLATALCQLEDVKAKFKSNIFFSTFKAAKPDDGKMLRGFPLVISVVGKSLCGKSAAEWRKRLRECYKAASILTEHEVLDCLQSTVEALNDNVVAKECFMDLGSFPEDQRIPATTLIDMWAELYNLDEDDAIANLHELSDRNLIEVLVTRKDANEDDGSYNEHFVTQHDLLRELAIRESNSKGIEHRKRVILEINENKIHEWLTEENELSIRAKLLSISTDETFSSSWPSMQAPEVEVLLLNFQTGKYSLPEFIEGMNKLKVLVLYNYGFVPAEVSNFPLLGSLSNLKRIRLEKVSIPSLFLTSMKWRKLEKMSLVMCNIGQAFNKSTNKISDAFPKLVDLTIDYCNDLEELPAGFCDLVLLRKLSITNCHKLLALPEDMGNLLDLEVLRLNSCIELTELPGTIGGLQKLQILDLSDCFGVKELPEQIGQLHNLRKLYMIECSDCELPSSVMNLFNLKEVIGDEETAVSWRHFKPCLPSLTIRVHKEINLNWLR
uniref:RPW8 domain-containing protein n=1 Tax=Salix viminalis TaxID=40686 RepID=A0A6N2KZS9_SALVM